MLGELVMRDVDLGYCILISIMWTCATSLIRPLMVT